MRGSQAAHIVDGHRHLRRYVLADERVVLAARRHWAKLLEPMLTAFAVVLVVGWVVVVLQPRLGEAVGVLWWLALAALGRLAWFVLLWRVEWFVATDKRMLLVTGLVTHQVAMMPMIKVTDMRYSRSVLGQMFGFGEFLLESAGQDQALRRIAWVDHPDETYRDLCATIFTPGDPRAPDPEDGDPDAGRRPGEGGRAFADPVVPRPPSWSPSDHRDQGADVPERVTVVGVDEAGAAGEPGPAQDVETRPLDAAAAASPSVRAAHPDRAWVLEQDDSGPVWFASDPSPHVRLVDGSEASAAGDDDRHPTRP